MTIALLLAAALQNDKTQANSRDDAWEAAWVTHCKGIYTTTGKTAGMVLHIGDSITYANQYGAWPRYGANKTGEDIAILNWCMATTGSPAAATANDTNGFNLAAKDVPVNPTRSMTAASSIDTAEYLSGAVNGGNNPMPAVADPATARTTVADGTTYTRSLHITTVASAFSAAQFAVLMLGTNDFGRPVVDFSNDLTAIVNALEARSIVVILSTIPPRIGGDVSAYNTAIRSLASTRGLPLIDFYEEILARQPGSAWEGTLIQALPDGIHPTYAHTAEDPYAGGSAATHQTGTNVANDGYLLRGWLTVQKLKEVKLKVVDTPAAPAPPTPPVVASSGEGDDEGACSCGTVRSLPWQAVGLLGLLLLAVRRR